MSKVTILFTALLLTISVGALPVIATSEISIYSIYPNEEFEEELISEFGYEVFINAKLLTEINSDTSYSAYEKKQAVDIVIDGIPTGISQERVRGLLGSPLEEVVYGSQSYDIYRFTPYYSISVRYEGGIVLYASLL
jgi:hypothetical protein